MAKQEKKAPSRPPPPQKIQSDSCARTSNSFTLLSEKDIVTFQDFQLVHDSVYKYIDLGLQSDEAGQTSLAVQSYSQGLQLLNKLLQTNVEKLKGCSGSTINRAKETQVKMTKTRQEITYRLQKLQEEQRAKPSAPPSPPSYEEALHQIENLPPAYEDSLTQLGESLMHREVSSGHLSDAEEIFCIPDGVQVYYISSDGEVTAPSYPDALRILKLNGEEDTEKAPAFLIVGDWIYPLIPGESPALVTTFGAYLFPDISSSPGSSVGLILPETVSLEERLQFNEILKHLSLFGDDQSSRESQSIDENLSKVSKGILTAAKWVSWGIEKGAEKAGYLIKRGSNYIRQQSRKCSQDRPVDPKIRQGVFYVREATGGAVKVTGYIVNKVGEATVHLAKEIAPHIRHHTNSILPRSRSDLSNADSPSHLDTVVEVAVTGLQGFSTVYNSLEKSAKFLGQSLADETVEIVKHSYGAEAAELTEDTMFAAGNVIMATHNVRNFGLKAIAKKTAKETGQAVYDEIQRAKGTMIQ